MIGIYLFLCICLNIIFVYLSFRKILTRRTKNSLKEIVYTDSKIFTPGDSKGKWIGVMGKEEHSSINNILVGVGGGQKLLRRDLIGKMKLRMHMH